MTVWDRKFPPSFFLTKNLTYDKQIYFAFNELTMPRSDQRISILLTFLIFIPCAQLSYKFLGIFLSVSYIFSVFLLFIIIFYIERNDWWSRKVKEYEHWLAIAWCIFMIAALAVLYPLAQSRYWGGTGSDRDDALMVGIEALLHFRYPYHEHTYAGLRLSPLPGALLLGMPFHLLGSVVWQNVAYGFPCIFLAARCLSGWRTRWLLIPLLTTGNIGFIQDFVTGGDFVLAGMYLAAALVLFADLIDRGPENPKLLAAAATLLGLVVCSRLLYPVALILATSYTFRHQGAAKAATYGFIAFAVAGILTLPFYLYDPVAFLPSNIINLFPKKWQWIQSIALPLIAATLALLPAVRKMDKWALLGLLAICLTILLLPGTLIRVSHGAKALHFWVPVALYAAMILLVRRAPGDAAESRHA